MNELDYWFMQRCGMGCCPTPTASFLLKDKFLKGKLIILKKYITPEGYTQIIFFGYREDKNLLALPL
jgi:hypothetical protein